MTLNVSARMDVETDGARRELGAAAADVERVGESAKKASTGTSELTRATSELAAAQDRAGNAARSLEGAQAGAARAADQNARSVGAQGAAYQNLGFQVQDVFAQLASGTNPLIILAQQGPQIASAFNQGNDAAEGAQSTLQGFASFLTGPWGAALFGAATLVGLLVQSMWEAEDATSELTVASDGLADAQSTLAAMFDLTTGKIISNTELTRLNTLAKIANAEASVAQNRAAASQTLEGLTTSWSSRFDLSYGGSRRETAARTEAEMIRFLNRGRMDNPVLRMLNPGVSAQTGLIGGEQVIGAFDRADNKRFNVDRNTFVQAIQFDAAARDQDRVNAELEESFQSGQLSDSFRKPGRTPRTKKPPKPKKDNSAAEAQKLADYADRTAERIARVNAQFDEQPRLIDQAAQASRELDAIIKDLQERKPPNFGKLIKDAQDAKRTVEDALLRPWREMTEQGQFQLDQLALTLQGRNAEAEALQRIQQFEERNGALSREQRAAVLGQVKAEEELNRRIEDRTRLQNIYLSGVDEARSSLEDLLTGGSVGDFLGDFQGLFKQLQGRELTERLFGPAQRQLEDMITGQTGLRSQVDQLASQHARVADASATLADANIKAADMILRATGRIANPDLVTAGANKVSGAGSLAANLATGLPIRDLWDELTGPITVNGGAGKGRDNPITEPSARKVFEVIVEQMVGGIATELDATFGTTFFSRMQGVFSGALTGYAQAGGVGAVLGGLSGLNEVLGPEVLGASLAKSVGGALDKAGNGAVAGYRNAQLLDALGIKNSKTGATVGGAIGGLTGIPGGDIIGSVLGGLIGGALKKAKTGTATITNADDAGVTAGNSKSRKEAALGLAGGVQDGLRRIADTLGADLGDFAVSIGVRDDKFRVDPTGKGATKTKKGAIDFGKDEAAAVAYAIRDAIGDGAIEGLSAAVQKALKSSDDIDKAVREALKVQEVEDLLGGIGASISKEVREFERQAKERVRIATEYGFNVAQIEARNAEDRAKLVSDILEDRVGSLQKLLDDLKFGDLAEGTAAERRAALLTEIAGAETDAKAGKDGAADKLADLNSRLVELSRDAYGTAGGEYSADRAAAIASAEAVIQIERDRIKAAQDAQAQTNQLLAGGNALTNETNQLLAEVVAALNRSGVSGFGREVIANAIADSNATQRIVAL